MVASRKDKPSYLSANLIFLRKQKGKSLQEMADYLGLSGKSSYNAYEIGDVLPNIHNIMKLCSFFGVSVVDLLYTDLEHSKSKPEERRMFEIAKVPVAAAAGYARSFGDNNYIKKLKTIQIPYEPYGIARAFDINGDSMEPVIHDGATVVGIKVDSSELRDNKSYIVVTVDGVQCKNVLVEKTGDHIYLISKNAKYPPKHILKDEVKEMWEVWKAL